MNPLTDVSYLKNLFRHYHIRPNDVMGQNFLIDNDVLDEIVKAADLKKTDTVLEVGPGLGVLTQKLAPNVKRLVAVEKDKKLYPILKSNIKEFKNVELVSGDVLKFHISKEIPESYKVVANIPYYLTSHLISSLLNLTHKPDLIVFMVQKEVAQRISAKAGELSVLGISVQFYADAETIAAVPKKLFWPAPKVDSAIIRIVPRNKYNVEDEKLFFRIIKAGFSGKRKQIHNTLKTGFKFSPEQVGKLLYEAKIDSSSRPQEFTIDQWVDLYKAFAKIL
jgi:16S rRNA (adenine1518-N6/adenine1519-N6)-dimethyltransferase